jgi:hypothetical protein
LREFSSLVKRCKDQFYLEVPLLQSLQDALQDNQPAAELSGVSRQCAVQMQLIGMLEA